MKNLFIGLIATGFMTLSSFTTAPVKKVTSVTNADEWCCTATSGHQSVTACGNYPCTRAKAALKAL
jgi:hypothetical protein